MKRIFFVLFVLLIISSQLIAQEVTSSGGDYFENSTISISWTLGEPVTETITAGTNILTQGFQQSRLTATEIFDIHSEDYFITVFPNPTENKIYLKINHPENLTYQFSDFTGKLISEKNIISNRTEISVNNLPSSVYFLKINQKNKLIKTFKIIKQ